MSPSPGGEASTADHHRARVRRPWLPESLAAHGLTSATVVELSYLVVEEMVEDVTAMTVSPWPAADGHGRLRFDASDLAEVALPTALLHAELYRGWLRRRPRIGDVFGAVVDRDALAVAAQRTWQRPLRQLLPAGVYDVSAPARTAAKLALYAARSDILDLAEAQSNGLHDRAARFDRPAAYRALGDSTGRGRAR